LPKGSGELLEVYELLGMREGPDDLRATAAMSMLASDWGSCLEILTAKDWQRALAALESFVREHPGDAVAEMYRGRVTELLRSPASAGWDGIMRFDQK
jgi:adenylate cyclase